MKRLDWFWYGLFIWIAFTFCYFFSEIVRNPLEYNQLLEQLSWLQEQIRNNQLSIEMMFTETCGNVLYGK
jgi:hypothetical protein